MYGTLLNQHPMINGSPALNDRFFLDDVPKQIVKLVASFLLFLLSLSVVYYYVDSRDMVTSFYGTSMIISSVGQDVAPETNLGKMIIAFVVLFSALYYMIPLWVILELPIKSLIAKCVGDQPTDKKRIGLLIISILFFMFPICCIYYWIEERNFGQSFWSACMLVSLNGQDDMPETSIGSILIAILALFSIPCSIFIWYLIEPCARKLIINYIGRNPTDKQRWTLLSKSALNFVFVVTILYFFIEKRKLVGSLFGACMLVSLNGQDERPETTSGQILIGIMALCSMCYAVFAWEIIEPLMNKLIRESMGIRRSLFNKYRNLSACLLLIGFLMIGTLFYLLIEGRTLIESLFGASMLVSLNGQDESPTTNGGQILIGFSALFSALIYAPLMWLLLETNFTEDLNVSESIHLLV